MAISLKKLYLLSEYWTTTDFTHPETGEKDSAEHWEPPSGYKMYSVPDIDVTKKGQTNSDIREKSTQIFYDFYAMELLHALLGTSNQMSLHNKIKATQNLSILTGINPGLVGIDWDNVEFPLSNVILPEKIRKQIDTLYEEVTIALSHKLQEHLRRTLIQEMRHLINHSTPWQVFRKELMARYNANKTLTKKEFVDLVGLYLPDMVKHLGAVKRLLIFSSYYSKMGDNDPGNLVSKGEFEEDDPSKYHDIEKDPHAIDISKKKDDEPEEDEGEGEDLGKEIPDYPGWEPEAGEFDPDDPFSKKIKKQWKDKLKEDYVSGKINMNTVKKVNAAVNKAGLTWEDIVLAFNNIKWTIGYGGEKWGEGVVSYLKLVQASKSQDVGKMASIIDHIYDLSHNGGPLLNKGGMYVALYDLDRRSRITHIARFLPNVSAPVKRLILFVMRHLPGTNVEVEKNIISYLQSPTIPFTKEQSEKLNNNNFEKYTNNVFKGTATYLNKQDEYTEHFFFAKAHTNGKFTLSDTMNTDAKVFDTFEQLNQYLENVISKKVKKLKSTQEKISDYISTHTPIKLPSDKAQLLFDFCKMGWYKNGFYYKAYLQSGKSVMFYAFSDGSYLIADTDYQYFYPTMNWNDIFDFAKDLTQTARPYPDPEEAKAHIAAGTSVKVSPSTSPPVAQQTTVTPTAYSSKPNQLPPNPVSQAEYTAHIGISSPPSKSIRLIKQDEDALVNIGFKPKLISGLVWYIHSGTNDAVKFFPNNNAKLYFTSVGGSGNPPIITFIIPKMLQWLQQNYTISTKKSPISEPTPKPATSTPTSSIIKGINPGALFNPQLQTAGFKWDQASGKYLHGQNSLVINPNRSSVLTINNGPTKTFNNIPELLAYLKKEYPSQKQ